MKRRVTRGSRSRSTQGGFTLIEILMVVALISILLAVSLPFVFNFMRHYQVRAGAEQVATEIQAARMQAIKKNVNYGVVFLVRTPTTYEFYFEDKALQGRRKRYDDADVDRSTTRTLPNGLDFVPAAAPNDQGFRFNRLGAMCDPDPAALGCPELTAAASGVTPQAAPPLVGFQGDGSAVITVRHLISGLTRTVSVTTGGRIRNQ